MCVCVCVFDCNGGIKQQSDMSGWLDSTVETRTIQQEDTAVESMTMHVTLSIQYTEK